VTTRPFREMNPAQKTSYVIGLVLAAILAAGVVAILVGLMWRAVVAVWS
jgi:hypothetical protein